MIRVNSNKRVDWQQKVEDQGFKFHTFFRYYEPSKLTDAGFDVDHDENDEVYWNPQPGINGEYETYWDESAYYQFTLKQIEEDIEAPTEELHAMCLQAVERIVNDEVLLRKLQIPEFIWERLRESWYSGQPHLYGRMDFSYDGKSPAKLLELNYDTPTSLYEGGAVQWMWLEDMMKSRQLPMHADQFNALHEFMQAAMMSLKTKFEDERPVFHMSSCRHTVEDRSTVLYLQEIAESVGFETRFLYVDEIGVNKEGEFVGLEEEPIQAIFKLYPWEDMFTEEFAPYLATAQAHWFEPLWKSILSNKGILPVLWEMFPNHPNLLPSYFVDSDHQVEEGWVKKPLFSREGSNITIRTHEGDVVEEAGPYTDHPYIIQAYHPLPKFGDSYTLIGSWVIGDRAAGIGIREDNSLITKDTSRFIPHVILG